MTRGVQPTDVPVSIQLSPPLNSNRYQTDAHVDHAQLYETHLQWLCFRDREGGDRRMQPSATWGLLSQLP